MLFVVPAAAVVVIVILFEVDDDGFVLLIDFTGLYHVFVLLVLCVCVQRENLALISRFGALVGYFMLFRILLSRAFWDHEGMDRDSLPGKGTASRV